MRRSVRAGIVGTAVVASLCAWPAAAGASSNQTSGTLERICEYDNYTSFAVIQVSYTIIRTGDSVTEIDVLTNEATGTSIRYLSHYTITFDPVFGAATLKGPLILDLGQDYEIYYYKGHASLYTTPGGYTAGGGGDQIIDVCAALR